MQNETVFKFRDNDFRCGEHSRSSTVDMQLQQIWSHLGCLAENTTQTRFHERLLRAAAPLTAAPAAAEHSGTKVQTSEDFSLCSDLNTYFTGAIYCFIMCHLLNNKYTLYCIYLGKIQPIKRSITVGRLVMVKMLNISHIDILPRLTRKPTPFTQHHFAFFGELRAHIHALQFEQLA